MKNISKYIFNEVGVKENRNVRRVRKTDCCYFWVSDIFFQLFIFTRRCDKNLSCRDGSGEWKLDIWNAQNVSWLKLGFWVLKVLWNKGLSENVTTDFFSILLHYFCFIWINFWGSMVLTVGSMEKILKNKDKNPQSSCSTNPLFHGILPKPKTLILTYTNPSLHFLSVSNRKRRVISKRIFLFWSVKRSVGKILR